MADFDLQSYRRRFDEVCQAEFGQRYNLGSLEKDFSHLRSEDQWLAAKHVASLFDRQRTPFGKYWQKPDEKELDQTLRKEHLCLALPADHTRDRLLAQRLLEIFRNTGVVSLILRFTHPDRFGTFSTPVVYLLQIHRETVLELYLTYCAELGVWKERFKMQSVADTETALWTFHKLATGSTKIKPHPELRAQFDADKWIQRRRASQAIRPAGGEIWPTGTGVDIGGTESQMGGQDCRGGIRAVIALRGAPLFSQPEMEFRARKMGPGPDFGNEE